MAAHHLHHKIERRRLVHQRTAVVCPVGKEMLRQQATATVQELAKQETGAMTVEQVLFTNFVLQ